MRQPPFLSTRLRLGTARRRAVRGIALLEVLIALLIFMLGVLGLIGMHGTLTRAQTESKVRADAAFLASEVVGRMWSDLGNLTGFEGDSDCSAPSCSDWHAKVAKVLPQGTATIDLDDSTGSVTVTLRWTLPEGGGHQYVTGTTIASKTAH